MIDNFEILDDYVIPKNVFLDMLNVYQNLGRADIYLEELGESANLIKKSTLEEDTFYFCEFLRNQDKLNDVTENRIRLLITKDSHPKNNFEKIITNTKKVLENIREISTIESFNSSDILMYLNQILGNNKVKFDMSFLKEKRVKGTKTNISLRLAFDKIIEKYFYCLKKHQFEPVMLSIITFLELRMIKPYRMNDSNDFTDVNLLASYLCLYYMMFHCQVKSYEITSFFEQLFLNNATLEDEIKKATMNYGESYFKLNDITLLFLKMINESFNDLKKICRNYQLEEEVSKSGNIENTIYRMDKQFTKEDVRKIHPYVSDSTIMRVFTKLKNENIIKPLSKGRNAIWIRIIDDDDPRRLFR